MAYKISDMVLKPQERANENINRLCNLIERVNAPNPMNPAGISDFDYYQVMAGLHESPNVSDEYWPGEMQTDLDGWQDTESLVDCAKLLGVIPVECEP